MGKICFNTFCDGLGSAYSDQNKWFDFYVDVPGVWRRFMVEGVRGGVSIEADDGDIVVDYFVLTTGECEQQGPIPLLYSNPSEISSLPFHCTFNDASTGQSTDCGFIQDPHEQYDWTQHSGGTPTLETGPSAVEGFGKLFFSSLSD